MKKNHLRTYMAMSCIALGLLLSGCSQAEASQTEETTVTADTAEAVETETSAVAAEQSRASDIDYSNGAPDREIESEVGAGGAQDIVINSHKVQEVSGSEFGDQYIAQDTVDITYTAGDLTGILSQTVSKEIYLYLNKDTGKWELLEDKLTACEVDNSLLPGSSWKSETLGADSLNSLFAGEIPAGDTGTLYIRFLKKSGLFSFNMDNENNTSSQRFFTTVGTGGKITWVGQAGTIEKSFNITEGSVTDLGEMILAVSCGSALMDMHFGTDVIVCPEQEYDSALGLEVDSAKVYMDGLPTFSVTTSAIENGQWKNEIGLKEGNISPELTWDAVEGASKYAVIMLDKVANNWLHWYIITDKTHLDEGEYTTLEMGYAGPYPPETHEYTVYVVALAAEPENIYCQLDTSGGDINSRLTDLNTSSGSDSGNVLAYGTVSGDYTPSELYYGNR